jgi:hypothetical protein
MSANNFVAGHLCSVGPWVWNSIAGVIMGCIVIHLLIVECPIKLVSQFYVFLCCSCVL